jgi:hypothetical protein
MAYNITIGEAQFEDMSYGDSAGLRVEARRESHDNAPTFANDDMTGSGNCRSPSYSVWTNFCRDTGIYDLFYGNDRSARYYESEVPGMHREQPILADHPGFAAINEHDVAYVKRALDAYRLKHPNAQPGFDDWETREGEGVTMQDANMARLIWLHYWMDWAVKNCERPIVENT